MDSFIIVNAIEGLAQGWYSEPAIAVAMRSTASRHINETVNGTHDVHPLMIRSVKAPALWSMRDKSVAVHLKLLISSSYRIDSDGKTSVRI